MAGGQPTTCAAPLPRSAEGRFPVSTLAARPGGGFPWQVESAN